MDRAYGEDPRRIAQAKAKEIASLSWEELDAYGKREEVVLSPTGRRLRVKSVAFWDMEEWASGIYVIVKVYPTRGWRIQRGRDAGRFGRLGSGASSV
jgi:hypothetical protein